MEGFSAAKAFNHQMKFFLGEVAKRYGHLLFRCKAEQWLPYPCVAVVGGEAVLFSGAYADGDGGSLKAEHTYIGREFATGHVGFIRYEIHDS